MLKSILEGTLPPVALGIMGISFGILLTVSCVSLLAISFGIVQGKPLKINQQERSYFEAGLSTEEGQDCFCLDQSPYWTTLLKVFPSQFSHRLAHHQTACDCGQLDQEESSQKSATLFVD